ncbi:MAG: DUF4142 domain-containing protein [Polyangiales bacterium]
MQSRAVDKKLGIVFADSLASTVVRGDDERTLAALRGRTGLDFDKAFITTEASRYEDLLIALDEQWLPNAKDVDVRAYLMSMRTNLSGHMKQARQIQNDLKRTS